MWPYQPWKNAPLVGIRGPILSNLLQHNPISMNLKLLKVELFLQDIQKRFNPETRMGWASKQSMGGLLKNLIKQILLRSCPEGLLFDASARPIFQLLRFSGAVHCIVLGQLQHWLQMTCCWEVAASCKTLWSNSPTEATTTTTTKSFCLLAFRDF